MSSAHLSPDLHRLPDPSSARPRRETGRGAKVLVYLLFALALVATVIMFFADSSVWLNIAVIAALWAAFIGAVLVSRYSGALSEEETRTRERDARHTAELDAERADHRRREVELEQSLAGRGGADRDETLESIRSELAALRAQLSELSGLDLGEDQVAVRARAERIVELERRSSDMTAAPASPADSTDTAAPAAAAGGAAPVSPFRSKTTTTDRPRSGGRRGGFATGTFSAVSWTGSDSEETSMIPLVVDARGAGTAPADTAASTSGTPDAPAAARDTPAAPAASAASAGTGTSATDRRGSHEAGAVGRDAVTDTGHHRRAAGTAGAAGAADPADLHGRRRADERAEGNSSVTVAELMAQLKKNAK